MKNAQILTIALAAALGGLTTAAPSVAAEPEYVTAALLFDRWAIEEGCLEGDIVIVFGGPSDGPSSGKALGSYDFGEFDGANINRVSTQYVTQGGVLNGVVWQIGDLTLPRHGVMLLNNGGDFVIEFCGFVSESSDVFSADEFGDKALIIVTGLVR